MLEPEDDASATEPSAPSDDAPEPAEAAVPGRPNILLIISDDQPTRLFDRELMPETFSRLVDQGARFDRAYVNTPLCCPSRAQIFSGLRGHHTGVDVNSIPLTRPTIIQGLQDAGYRTILGGKYLNSMPCTKPPGFDRWACVGPGIDGYTMVNPKTNVDGTWRDLTGYSTDLQADFIADVVNTTPTSTPFFAVYSPTTPHLPANDPRCASMPVTFTPSGAYDQEMQTTDTPGYLRRPPLSSAERAQVEDEYVRMARAVRCLDGSIGRLLSRIESRSNTAVFFVSDNGYLYGEHRRYQKTAPYEEAVRVPLAVRYPAWIDQAIRTPALTENIDITATVAELAGVPWAGDGVSLGPLLRRETSSVRNEVLIEHCQGATAPCPWTAFQFTNDPQLAIPGSWGIVAGQHKYLEYETGERQLFDLLLDPGERTNRAADPAFGLIRSHLANRLTALRSPPSPQTAIVSGPSGQWSARTAQFTYFTQSRSASYRCRLDRNGVAGGWHACNGERSSYGPLADGSYVFSVAGTNEAGVVDGTPATRSFSITAVGPPVSIDTPPAPDSATRDISIRFSSTQLGVTYQCRFSLAANTTSPWQSCVSPYRRTGLADGAWRFEVRSVSGTGVTSPPALALFTVDTLGPAMVIDASPRLPATASRSSRIVFHSDQPVSTGISCKLDSGPVADCSSGTHTAVGLSDGPHTLNVTGVDLAGRARTTTFAWIVDTEPPVVTFTNGPPTSTTSTTAEFWIAVSEPRDGVYCRLDTAHALTPCPTTLSFDGLGIGDHSLTIVVKDRAKNLSEPVTWTWRREVSTKTGAQ